jgi:hypothetical protein
VFGQHLADHVLVNLDAEGPPDDERYLWPSEAWISTFQLDDGMSQGV